MNLLDAEATGFRASMLGYPYDDLKGWRAIYPEDIFEEQFRKLSTGWEAGLDLLKEASSLVAEAKQSNIRDLQRVALAAYCHFRSTYLQIAFVRLRDAGQLEQRRAEIGGILDEEIKVAKTLHGLAREDCRIGFEVSNHYFYTLNDLKEKVLNCEHLLAVLCQ